MIDKIILTGDRPTGRLHLGHFVGSIKNRIKFQDTYKTNYYMVADMQGLTDNFDNPEKIHENTLEVVMDNLACGLDSEKVTIFLQSEIYEISFLYQVFMNLVTLQQASHNPTVKSEALDKGYSLHSRLESENVHTLISETMNDAYEQDAVSLKKGVKPEGGNTALIKGVPLGFLSYPISQAADILFVKASIVPVGEDQIPVIEQTNDIVKKFNSIYGDVFEKVQGVVGEVPRLIGIDGDSKASKSKNNAIYLSDSREEIEAKVMRMYTDPNHINVSDPGKVEGNVVFEYLDIFDTNKEKVEELKQQYQKGGLGDVVLKKYLTDVLDVILEPIREKRKFYENNKDLVLKILEDGNSKARLAAKETVAEVKQAMKLNYFLD